MILVTGANGWLGRRLVRLLCANGYRGAIRILVQPGENVNDLMELGAHKVEGDVRNGQNVRAFLKDAQGAILIHLVGVIHPQRTHDWMEINYEGTKTLIREAGSARVARAIVMSSNSPFGAGIFDENARFNPYMGYGRSKMEMERWLRTNGSSGLFPDITIIRACWFYGPEQPARQTRFFSMIKAGRFPIVGDGMNRRSLSYVDSLAHGIFLAMQNPQAAGRTYWLADEHPYSMLHIVATVREVLRNDFGMKLKPTTIRLPSVVSDIARAADWSLQKLGFYNQELHVLSEMNLTIGCTTERAKRELGYKPLVDLREGMRRSVQWALEHGGKI
jgi:nucleoside-diphosphate-sugar epimerase